MSLSSSGQRFGIEFYAIGGKKKVLVDLLYSPHHLLNDAYRALLMHIGLF